MVQIHTPTCKHNTYTTYTDERGWGGTHRHRQEKRETETERRRQNERKTEFKEGERNIQRDQGRPIALIWSRRYQPQKLVGTIPWCFGGVLETEGALIWGEKCQGTAPTQELYI